MFALPTAALEVLNALHGEQTYASPGHHRHRTYVLDDQRRNSGGPDVVKTT
jgi:hypothetical protein